MNTPSDANARKFPVSVKGVILLAQKVVLLKNERDEWELPGGKLEAGELLEKCLSREIYEELNISVQVGRLLDAWIYTIFSVDVLILTYLCHADENSSPRISHEHKELGFFEIGQLEDIPLPDGYKKAIRDAYLDQLSGAEQQTGSTQNGGA